MCPFAPRCLFLPLLAWLALAAPAAAQSSLEAARRELRATTAVEVEALASWCQEHRLYLERDRLYRALVELEPDHREARRHLRYRRTQAGWEALAYSPPANRAPEHLGEYHARRVKLEEAWRGGLSALVMRFEDELEERERHALEDEILVLVPDDARARERRGEVRDPVGGSWILRESAAGRARAAELEARAAGLRRVEHALERAALPPEIAFLPWKERLSAPDAQLSAVGPAEEAAQIVADAMLAAQLFREVFGEAPVLAGELTVYAFDRQETLDLFLANPLWRHLAGGDVAERSRSIHIAVGERSAEARRVAALERVLEQLFRGSFGIGDHSAWARAGLVRRWCELLRGTAPATDKARRGETASSLEALRTLLAAGHRPDLAELLAKPASELSPADELVAYALVRFVLEGSGTPCGVLLDELGRSSEGAERVLSRRLGFELDELEARLLRWISEASPAPAARPARK